MIAYTIIGVVLIGGITLACCFIVATNKRDWPDRYKREGRSENGLHLP